VRGAPVSRRRQISRARAQLEQALRRRDVDDTVAAAVLDRLTEAGLIDDAAFAGAWVDSRHAGRGLGRRALAAELRRRGVAEDTVRDAVDDLTPDREEATARALVRRRLQATRRLDTEVRTRRLLGMLARKGYPPGLCYRLVREELEAEGADIDLPDPELD
jgi:regulatory protein